MIKIGPMSKDVTQMKYLEEEYGVKVLSYTIGMPALQENKVEVPGRNGLLDLTNALGGTYYNNREIEVIGVVTADKEGWHKKVSELGNLFHGERLRLTFDTDPEYYYAGRCVFDPEFVKTQHHKFTLKFDADPFKYPVFSSNEDWLWDPFNFETGVIRAYNNIVVSGTKNVDIIAYEQEESPKFYVTLNQGQSSMKMIYGEDTYHLINGMNSFPQISISSIDVHTDIHRFTFSGYGRVSISLSGGIL